jgi:hypothetical protein
MDRNGGRTGIGGLGIGAGIAWRPTKGPLAEMAAAADDPLIA